MPRMKENVITLIDDDRSETYATLEEAIRAARLTLEPRTGLAS